MMWFDVSAKEQSCRNGSATQEEMLRLQKEHAEPEALKEGRRYDLARRIEQWTRRLTGWCMSCMG
jgi:hypothetical protein